jgi:hypothetical protein
MVGRGQFTKSGDSSIRLLTPSEIDSLDLQFCRLCQVLASWTMPALPSLSEDLVWSLWLRKLYHDMAMSCALFATVFNIEKEDIERRPPTAPCILMETVRLVEKWISLPNMANLFCFCRLYSFSHQPPRHCLGPAQRACLRLTTAFLIRSTLSPPRPPANTRRDYYLSVLTPCISSLWSLVSAQN